MTMVLVLRRKTNRQKQNSSGLNKTNFESSAPKSKGLLKLVQQQVLNIPGGYKEMSSIVAWPIALSYMSPNEGGGGKVALSHPMSTAVHLSLNKLWRSTLEQMEFNFIWKGKCWWNISIWIILKAHPSFPDYQWHTLCSHLGLKMASL